MKLILIFIVVLVVAGSFLADYKWKQWIAKQKEARDPRHQDPDR